MAKGRTRSKRTAGRKNCRIGRPCGGSCVDMDKQCRPPLSNVLVAASRLISRQTPRIIKATPTSRDRETTVSPGPWSSRPGPQTITGIVNRAKKRIALANAALPKIEKLLDDFEERIDKALSDYRDFLAANPGLSRDERLNTPLAKTANKLFAERNSLEQKRDKVLNDKLASDGILAGYNAMPVAVRMALRRQDAVVRSAAKVHSELTDLEKTLAAPSSSRDLDDVDERIAKRDRINQLILENHSKFTDSNGVSAMNDLRSYLMSRGEGSTTNPRFDLPPELQPLESDFQKTFDEFVQLTNGRGGSSLKDVVYTDARASAHQSGWLNVGANPDGVNRTVMFHEMGHHVEFESRDLKDRAAAIIRSRATGGPQQLEGYYRPGEIAFPDHWGSAYTGKSYADRSTEVYAMGLQDFTDATSTWKLYVEDREHFLFTMGALADD